jgi:hypothetical protein
VKAGYAGVLVAVLTAAAATLELTDPFLATLHAWWFALAVSLAGVSLLAMGVGTAFGAGGSRPAAIAAFGGGLLSACVAFAAFLVGHPDRVPAVPGQSYRPPHSSSVRIDFPDVSQADARAGAWPAEVTIDDGSHAIDASPGDRIRTGAFVFRVDGGPVAMVDARSPSGEPVTITQPDSPAFLSRILTFLGTDGDQPEDYFAVPALHRDVQVDYYAGLPSHGIDIPFLALRISEENGGSLYEGVAVSNRPLEKAGIGLTFLLGTYPVLTMTSAPPLVPYIAGMVMTAAGIFGYAVELLVEGRRRTASRGK